MSDTVATTANQQQTTTTTEEAPKNPQRYRKVEHETFLAYDEAKSYMDRTTPTASQRLRIRRRANGSFDLVTYELIKA
jgi:hypothetical protein